MKVRSQQYYERKFQAAIRSRLGSYDDAVYGLAVWKAASDFHHLEQIDAQIDRLDEFVTQSPGSTGQMKQEINPLIAQRDKTSRTCMDALDALQLTPRSTFKKTDGKAQEEDDPMLQYMNNV